jgi:hypothetical protein
VAFNCCDREFWLYHSIHGEQHSGVRVAELACNTRLVDMLSRSAGRDGRVNELPGKVRFVGEILIADTPLNKKWIGWLWGWGIPLWGFKLGM